jgi:hypothetical protein
MKLFKSLFTPKPTIDHEVFGKLILAKGKNGPYWIHESYSDDDPTISIETLSGNPPTDSQLEFYKNIVSDLDRTFGLVQEKLVPAYEQMLGTTFPECWQEVLIFAGVGIPVDGNSNLEWDLTFELTEGNLGYLFNCYFDNGSLVHVGVDT